MKEITHIHRLFLPCVSIPSSTRQHKTGRCRHDPGFHILIRPDLCRRVRIGYVKKDKHTGWMYVHDFVGSGAF